MVELRDRVSQVAREAVRVGQADKMAVVSYFRENAPVSFRIPLDLISSDAKGFATLIERVGNGQLVLEGQETTGDTGVLAITQGVLAESNRCSGFLVSSDILVTAGHCIAEGFLGGVWIHDATGTNSGPSPLRNKIHEDFGVPFEFANDIGVIRLSESVGDAEILPIASNGTIDLEPKPDFRIIGYGKHTVAGAFSLTPVKRTAPVALMRNRRGETGLARREFLIGDPTATDGDACDGDSGGAVIAEVSSQDQLVGLISRGVKPLQTHCGDGTICVRLDEYLGWIDQAIQDLGGQARPV